MSKQATKIEHIKHKVVSKQSAGVTSLVSGTDNPIGLHCQFYRLENGDMATSFKLTKWHEGHEGIGHGGVVYYILDEVMGRSNCAYDVSNGREYAPVVTGEITVRNVSYATVGETMYAFGRVVKEEGRKHFVTSEMIKEDGTVVARGKAVFFKVDNDSMRDIEDSPELLTEDDPKEL